MPDVVIRVLERRYKETGLREDWGAWVRERVRVGQLKASEEPCPNCQFPLTREDIRALCPRAPSLVVIGGAVAIGVVTVACAYCGTEWCVGAWRQAEAALKEHDEGATTMVGSPLIGLEAAHQTNGLVAYDAETGRLRMYCDNDEPKE